MLWSHEHNIKNSSVDMLPLDWVRSASAWSWSSSSLRCLNVGGDRSPPTPVPVDVARTMANRGGVAPGRRLHPARTAVARSGVSVTAKAISCTLPGSQQAAHPRRQRPTPPAAVDRTAPDAVHAGRNGCECESGSGKYMYVTFC
jgi:hypothetical protein